MGASLMLYITDMGFMGRSRIILICVTDELSRLLPFSRCGQRLRGVWELQTLLVLIPCLTDISRSDLGTFWMFLGEIVSLLYNP